MAWIENKEGLAKVRLTTDEIDACKARGNILYTEICGMCNCLCVTVAATGGGKIRLNPTGADHLATCPGVRRPGPGA